MNILFLVSSLGSGGAERVAVTLSSAWADRGDHVTLMPTFSGRGECFYPTPSAVNLVYLADLVPNKNTGFFSKLRRILALRKFIVTCKPDIIISFLTNVNVASIAASIKLKIPIVVCERSDPFIHPISTFLNLTRRFSYPFASALVVQTNAVSSKYASTGIPNPRLFVIPNPVPSLITKTQHIGSNDSLKRLIAIGRLDEGKQFGMLLNVFAKLSVKHLDWSLRIVGDGPMRSNLLQHIDDLGLKGRVELPGRSNAIEFELAAADAFVMTSKFEGFPNALVEAMGIGLPCVAFDCPSGPREISMDGQVAVLVPLNDEQAMTQALDRLMNDKGFRKYLGSRARDSVIERFSVANILKQWDLLFNSLIRS